MKTGTPLPGLTLDAGALIAIDRGAASIRRILGRAGAQDFDVAVPANALAQVWRSGLHQARLAAFLRHRATVVPVDDWSARRAGELCAATATSDVVDASVVICALQRRHAVVTSDPTDLRRLAPKLPIITV